MIPKLENGFYGCQLTSEQADIAVAQYITPKLMQPEAGLMQKKWFDYRRMHPAIATYMFVSEYVRSYKRMISVAYDVDRAKYVSGMKAVDFMDGRERNTFWKLRQKVDELGMRYDFFMRHAMNWCVERGWRQPPRPSQIYANDDLIVDVMNQWDLECRSKIQYPEDPHYRVENWTGSVDQLAYEQWLITAIKRRPHPMFALNSAIYEMGTLRIEAALESFPASIVEEATDYCLQVQSYSSL